MSGGYAHMTATNLVSSGARLDAVAMPDQAKGAVLKNLRFCELGAVAPDYPYLDLVSSSSAKWADKMHYEKTGAVIKAGIRQVRRLTGVDKQRALAWLLGYTSHVAMDLSIHPVVNKRVGPYDQNKAAHRKCEMHQDTYIFQRLNLGKISSAEFIKTGIKTCNEGSGMDVINGIWTEMLKEVYPEEAATNTPNPKKWHWAYTNLLDNVSEESDRMFAISRHLLGEQGLVYPLQNEIDQSYISGLSGPFGATIDYDQLFDFGLDNVGRWWGYVGTAVYNETDTADGIVNGNLDTGMFEGADRNSTNPADFVFWNNPPVA